MISSSVSLTILPFSTTIPAFTRRHYPDEPGNASAEGTYTNL